MPLPITRRRVLEGAAAMSGLLLPLRGLGATGTPIAGFTHSVASGDPQRDSVVLWTRFVPKVGGSGSLTVEVAETENFSRIVARGKAASGPDTDWCAHARPTGLKPGRWHWYRFVADDGTVSPVGRTKTLPSGAIDRVRIGVFSCSNATSGWFTAYAHAAARDDLDLLIHTGDYIYESPTNRSDAVPAIAAARGIAPAGEAIALADYRMRYASYRRDPGLVELHRRFPMITIWDDHETANNAWAGGASNHDAEDGDWRTRSAAGVRAWREWLPMRHDRNWDRYPLGDLATLFRLETRLTARTRQLDYDDLPKERDVTATLTRFRDGPLADPSRTMLGTKQERWIADGLSASVASGQRWQILAQQVIMAPTRLPIIDAGWLAPGTKLSEIQQRDLAVSAAVSAARLPLSLDRWDGYPAARARLLSSAARANANLVVLSGDSHNAWAYDLVHDGRPVGVEFAGQAVSSLGIEKRFGGDPTVIARNFVAANPALRWCDTSRRGYMVIDVSRDAIECEWLFLASRNSLSTTVSDSQRVAVSYGARTISR